MITRLLLVACIGLACACGSGGTRYIDGGVVTPEGWPERGTKPQVRCPAGTDLLDERLPDGRRTITCKSMASPLPKGFLMTWYPDGELALQAEFDESGRQVTRKSWDSAGRLELEETYSEGLIESRVSYYPTGKIREEATRFEDGVRIRRLQPDGEIEAEGVIRGESRVGEWTEWADSATEVVSYVDGQKSGEASRVYLDGSIESGSYLEGKRQGRWVRKSSQGLPLQEAEYLKGLLEGRFLQFYPTGQLKKEVTYKGGRKHGMARYYWSSGDPEREGAFECDVETGPWTFYYDDGSKKSEGVFVTGRRAGIWKEYTQARDVASAVEHPEHAPVPCEPL